MTDDFAQDRPRTGDWMQTFTGRQFWPLDPRVDEVDVLDIAAALSKTVRYGGHSLRFYSVAEHSVLMARKLRTICGARDEDIISALFHDASEAYLVDVPRPIKRHLANYAEIEAGVMGVIATRFSFPWPMPDVVRFLDESILHDELLQIMAPPPADWRLPHPPLGVKIECWSPDQAMAEFLREAAACGAV